MSYFTKKEINSRASGRTSAKSASERTTPLLIIVLPSSYTISLMCCQLVVESGYITQYTFTFLVKWQDQRCLMSLFIIKILYNILNCTKNQLALQEAGATKTSPISHDNDMVFDTDLIFKARFNFSDSKSRFIGRQFFF